MTKFLWAVMLMLVCSVAFACPGGSSCGCGGQDMDAPPVVVNVDAIDKVIANLEEVATQKVREVDQGGQNTAALSFQLSCALDTLRRKGFTEEEIAPVTALQEEIEAVLKPARSTFSEAVMLFNLSSIRNAREDNGIDVKTQICCDFAQVIVLLEPIPDQFDAIADEYDKVQDVIDELLGLDEDGDREEDREA